VSAAALTHHDAVLFDLDGVLVDSRVPFARGINHALTTNGLRALPEQDLHRYLGPPLHDTFRRLTPESSLVGPCVESYRARYRETAAGETTVFPGIAELLAGLARGSSLLVATSKPRALAEPLLEALDLRSFFVAVVGPELASEDEPKDVTIGRALARLSPTSRSLMVGDRRHDIAGAHVHRIPAIGVLWGIGSEQELQSAGADALVRWPHDLATLLGVGRPGRP
jgi:phosphoglycolate phosphatase